MATTFAVLIHQDAPFPDLVARWREAEAAGFNAAYAADHTQDYRDPDGYWLDGWTVLAAAAAATSRIRIGPLVANPILRPAATLALTAVAADQLSGGRLDVGVGTGIAAFDHAATGTPYWSLKERVTRFREYVEILDGLLCAREEPFSYQGQHLCAGPAKLVPPPVQRPRPPLILAGQSPTVRRVAAERADVWNTHGPFGADTEQILEVTRRQNAEIDGWCADAGRDPAALRRSVLLLGPTDPWVGPGALARLLDQFVQAGATDFVLPWPGDGAQRKVYDDAVTGLLPQLRP